VADAALAANEQHRDRSDGRHRHAVVAGAAGQRLDPHVGGLDRRAEALGQLGRGRHRRGLAAVGPLHRNVSTRGDPLGLRS
jgi:hypothetical protein